MHCQPSAASAVRGVPEHAFSRDAEFSTPHFRPEHRDLCSGLWQYHRCLIIDPASFSSAPDFSVIDANTLNSLALHTESSDDFHEFTCAIASFLVNSIRELPKYLADCQKQPLIFCYNIEVSASLAVTFLSPAWRSAMRSNSRVRRSDRIACMA